MALVDWVSASARRMEEEVKERMPIVKKECGVDEKGLLTCLERERWKGLRTVKGFRRITLGDSAKWMEINDCEMGLVDRTNDGKLTGECLLFSFLGADKSLLYILMVSLIFSFFGLRIPSSDPKSMKASSRVMEALEDKQNKTNNRRSEVLHAESYWVVFRRLQRPRRPSSDVLVRHHLCQG